MLLIKPSYHAILGAETVSIWDASPRPGRLLHSLSTLFFVVAFLEACCNYWGPEFGYLASPYPAKKVHSHPDHSSLHREKSIIRLVISRQDVSRLDRRYSAGSSFQACGRRRCANDMLLHGAFKKQWVDVSGASFGWPKLVELNFFVGA